MTLQLVTESNYIKQIYANISEKLLTNSQKVDIVPTVSNNTTIPIIHMSIDMLPDSKRFGNNRGKAIAIVNINCIAGSVAKAGDIAQSCVDIINTNKYIFQSVNMDILGEPKIFTRPVQIDKNIAHNKVLVYQIMY